MTRARAKSASGAGNEKSTSRERRSRPLPKWLTGSNELDDLARRRCLMILSVLSGERPVSDVIEEQQISRGTYYNFEQRALEGMLSALIPLGTGEGAEVPSSSPAKRIAELEAKVAKLERDKRRGERLLFLTKSVIGRGPVKSASGRPQKKVSKRRSTTSGRSASMGSARAKTTAPAKTSVPSSSPVHDGPTPTPSIPNAGGVDAR